MLVEGKNIVVTGSNRGIGKAILKVFAQNGANVWACSRSVNDEFRDYLNTLSAQTGVSIWPVYFDLADTADISQAAKQMNSSERSVDILVNNAGIMFTALFQMTPQKNLKEVFDINFFSQMLLTQLITKKMCRQKRGAVVNISSSAGIDGNEGRVAYAASKAAMLSATKVLARELARYNIRVNAIAPGLTNTDMMVESTSDSALKEILDGSCMGRIAMPEEIANVVLFLSSDLSSYMTGQVLRVDGGM